MATSVIPDIRALCLDVDGVLTDGRVSWDDAGLGSRHFHIHDGLALDWYQDLGGIAILCSGKKSKAVAARASELKIKHVIQGSQNKVADMGALIAPLGLSFEQLAVMGDDLPDIPLMRRCGLPIAVANAVAECKAAAKLVTRRNGGEGAVREAIEHLLHISGRWNEVLAHYGISGDD